MIIPPAEWYRQQDLSKHYIRKTDLPFETGVSRGQLRCIKACADAGMQFLYGDVHHSYAVIADNRMRKGRIYGFRLKDWLSIAPNGDGIPFHATHLDGTIAAAALCVFSRKDVLFVSAWGDSEGEENSPVAFLCARLYNWCSIHHIHTLDIGVAGDENLSSFKKRLGFSCG